MVRRFHRSIYDELDDLRASMDFLYQLALEPADNPQVPPEEIPGIVCRSVHTPAAEVTVSDGCITVTADLAAAAGNAQVSVDLINDTTLKITTDYYPGDHGRTGRNAVVERESFSLHRIVPLPGPVIKDGARMSIRNSVLDLHLKKAGTQ